MGLSNPMRAGMGEGGVSGPAGAGFLKSLSARILLLSVAFLLLGEVLIFLPSIARFRLAYLEEVIARAHLATIPLRAEDLRPSPEVEDLLLTHADALRIRVVLPEGEIVVGEPVPVDRTYVLPATDALSAILDALDTLRARGARLIRIRGPAPMEAGVEVIVVLAEAQLWFAMVNYARRIVLLSLMLSAFLAALLFFALRGMVVRPLRRLTHHLARFRERPEDAAAELVPSGRGDEIGQVEEEMARMQREVRRALQQKTRLAALGAAVTRIHHDLKNMLAGAILVSDRLETSGDPKVRDAAKRLLATLERAARLCTDTLRFARSELARPRREPVSIQDLVEEAALVLGPGMRVERRIPPALTLSGDRDQLFRVFLNLFKNAEQATGGKGTIRVEAVRDGNGLLRVEVADDGPGIPPHLRDCLFTPFANGAATQGSGLGLAICREILRAHGGDIALARTGEGGTVFHLSLPLAEG